jgi:hypothetical protein
VSARKKVPGTKVLREIAARHGFKFCEDVACVAERKQRSGRLPCGVDLQAMRAMNVAAEAFHVGRVSK